MNCTVIIPAAGSGSRFGADIPKQYLPLRGRPLIARTVEKFLAADFVEAVIVCADPSYHDLVRQLGSDAGWRRVVVVEGGAARQDSVLNGLRHAQASGAEWVAVHDAVRPFFTVDTLRRTLAAAREYGGAVPALPVTDTIHRLDDGLVAETPQRSQLVAAQTPQCFLLSLLVDALQRAVAQGLTGTDEAGVVAHFGGRVAVVEGDRFNVKITRPEDLEAAERNFERWTEGR